MRVLVGEVGWYSWGYMEAVGWTFWGGCEGGGARLFDTYTRILWVTNEGLVLILAGEW